MAFLNTTERDRRVAGRPRCRRPPGRAALHRPGRARGGRRATRATQILERVQPGSDVAFVGHYLAIGPLASVRAGDRRGDRQRAIARRRIPPTSWASCRGARGPRPRSVLLGRRRPAAARAPGWRRRSARRRCSTSRPCSASRRGAVTPASGGARVRVHSALDPSLTRLSAPATLGVRPQPAERDAGRRDPDVRRAGPGPDRPVGAQRRHGGRRGGRDRAAARRGSGLRSSAEGVSVSQLTSIFHVRDGGGDRAPPGLEHAGDHRPHPARGPGPLRARLAGDPAGPAVHPAEHRPGPGAGVQ